jgi:RNA polymerase primary sigma factor
LTRARVDTARAVHRSTPVSPAPSSEAFLLTRETEQRLARELAGHRRAIRSGGAGRREHAEAATAIRDRLVAAHLDLVVRLARAYRRLELPLADLVQEGSIGLMRAVEKFDPGRGVRFATYARWWIVQAFIRATQRQSRLVRRPSHVYERLLRCDKERARLSARLGREPTDAELCDGLGQSQRQLEEALAVRRAEVSLSWPRTPAERDPLEATLAAPASFSPAVAADRALDRPLLNFLLDTIGPRERVVVGWRFGLSGGEPQTRREIASRLGISAERARQIEVDALAKLRAAARRRGPPLDRRRGPGGALRRAAAAGRRAGRASAGASSEAAP